MKIDLNNKNILITGGTSAIGQSIFYALKNAGANLFFTYFSNLEKAKELESCGATSFRLDISSKKELSIFVKNVKSEISQLDLLINNAVVVADKLVVNMREDEWDKVIFADLMAPLFLMRSFKDELSNGGKILNMTSQVGEHGAVGQANYSTAKGELIAATKEYALKYADLNILVNAINPGFVLSSITESLPTAVIDNAKEKSCFGLLADPKALANFVAFYASGCFSNVSGQIFNLDSRIL